jgi:hypothetical protein
VIDGPNSYLLRRIERWLLSKHATLWADWDITDPKRRRKAAEWFLKEMESFREYESTPPRAGRGA